MMNKLKLLFYRLMRYDVVYRWEPTKEFLRHAKWVSDLQRGFDPDHTAITPPRVGDIGVWLPYRTREMQAKKESLIKAHQRSGNVSVKPKWWEGDYKAKIREHAKSAIDENRTIH